MTINLIRLQKQNRIKKIDFNLNNVQITLNKTSQLANVEHDNE